MTRVNGVELADLHFQWAEQQEMDGWTGRERVALGGYSRATNRAAWYELHNVSDDPSHNFLVDGAEVQRVLERARLEGVSLSVLWHSHEEQMEPSAIDIESFPHWLSVGVVFSARHRTLVAYDRTGVILSSTALPAHATGGI